MSTSSLPIAVTGGSPARAESYRWIVLLVAVLTQAMAAIVSQGVYTLVPFWQSSFQLSQAAAGLAVSFMNGGQILSMLLLGIAIDRYGERSVVALTMVAMGLTAFAAAAFGSSYPFLLLFLAMLGAWYASVQPGGTRAVMRWFPPHLRGFAAGVRQAGLPLGTALAALLLPALALRFGWRTAACVQGVAGMAGGLLFGLFHRDDVGLTEQRGAAPGLRALLALLSLNPAFRPVLCAGVAMAAFQFTFSAYILLFLSRHLGVKMMDAASVFAVAQGIGIAGRVALAACSDRIWPGRRMRSLAWTMLASALAVVMLLALPAQPASWMTLTVFALIGLFGIGWYPLWLLQVAEMAPKAAVASTVSFAMTLNLIGISLMPPLFGLTADLAGYPAAWSLLVAVLLLGAMQLQRAAGRMGQAAPA